jgi:hypothetical protein
MTATVRFLIVMSFSHLSNNTGILLESFDQISERLEKTLPPIQDQLFPAEAVFPLTPPLSDDSDVPDGCNYKGKPSIRTIHAGGTADRLRKLNRIRSRIQRHRGFSRCNSGHPTTESNYRDAGTFIRDVHTAPGLSRHRKTYHRRRCG